VLFGLANSSLAQAPAEAQSLERCRAQETRAARDCYRRLLRDDSPPLLVAGAYRGLGQPAEANAAFRRALELEPESVEVRLAWALLFIETHKPSEALRLYREAIEIDSTSYAARLGEARVLAEQSETAARTLGEGLLEREPERPEAYLLLARIALEAGERSRARELLSLAEARLEPPVEPGVEANRETSREAGVAPGYAASGCSEAHLEAYAWRASLERLEATAPMATAGRPTASGAMARGPTAPRATTPGVTSTVPTAPIARGPRVAGDAWRDDAWTTRALECRPASGEVYERQAQMLVLSRRYREASALLRRSVEVEPSRSSAHALLAMQLMRLNEPVEAREHLELAYAGDAFDPQVVNLLRLFDRLDQFSTLRRVRPGDASAWLELRLDPREERLLASYSESLAAAAVERFERVYAHRLSEPIVVEMYPDHDDFAVRTAGVPGLGLLGATFGHVVVMDSPAARRNDDAFLWGSVLWHELAHVYTLEASAHRVSRWFSEGISVYEEWTAGPAPQAALPSSFVAALAEDRLLPIQDLDRGFQRPTWPGQVAVSYVQAGLVCEYIAETFGEARFAEILAGYRAGEDTPAILERVLERPLARLNRESVAFARRRAGPLLEELSKWQQLRRRAARAIQDGAWERVVDLSIELEAVDPRDASVEGALALRARALRELARSAEQLDALWAYRGVGGRDPDLLRELVGLLRAADRPADAISVLEDLRYVAPLEEWLHAELGRAYFAAGRDADALAELELWEALEPLDQVGVHFALAQTHRRLNQPERARRQLLYALEVAPEFRPGLEMLLELQR